ncbi:MAG: protein kinase [Polyangiaceae bacterium]
MADYREFQDGELIAGTRYQVQRLIGVGGMGTVYEVEHVELGKRFVLKALLRELSRREDLVIRLRNEWRALGRLEHPNIVTVTDAGTSATGVPFYVMERLEGETLSERMRRTRRFPVREAVEIAIGVLEGLAAAHQIGVVHRDVKPPNIFLVGEGRPKVLDFGVAKIQDDPGVVTARGIAVGTPRYMSPEQARGESVDGRADVYSTGLILFEMLCGASPFDDARDANELILAHLVRRARPVSTLVRGISAELDAAVANMLAKSRDDRPATATEAARVLREVATELASSASSESRLSSVPPSAGPYEVTLLPTEAERYATRAGGGSRRATLTSGSLSDGMLHPCPELSPRAPSRAFPGDTVFSPPSFAGEAPSLHTADAVVPTEVLTAVPQPEAAPTRTSYPLRSVSETPPPVTPTPDQPALALKPAPSRGLLLASLGAVGAAALIAALWLRGAAPPEASHSAASPRIAVSSTVVELPRPVTPNQVRAAQPEPVAERVVSAPPSTPEPQETTRVAPKPPVERVKAAAASHTLSASAQATRAPSPSTSSAPGAPAKKRGVDALPTSGL